MATRWRARLEPTSLMGRIMMGEGDLPIINVFRFENGKIVEIWNHRHDIDTGQTIMFTAQGLAIGLAVAIIPTVYVFVLRRKVKKLRVAVA